MSGERFWSHPDVDFLVCLEDVSYARLWGEFSIEVVMTDGSSLVQYFDASLDKRREVFRSLCDACMMVVHD